MKDQDSLARAAAILQPRPPVPRATPGEPTTEQRRRLLAGESLDEPIIDPANPNLRNREELGRG